MGRDYPFELRPGVVLAGRYQIESELGRGGMGVVLGARHVTLGVRVAVKVMRPEAVGEPDAARRFLREARAAARITSDHVVRVFDVGTLDDGQPFMAMEYLEGTDLGRTLAERVRFSVDEASTLLLQAIEALNEAHALGIVHRDLKPSNLFLAKRRDGQAELKLLDFGAAKIVTPAAPGELSGSLHAHLVGTPHYMSPEQLRAVPDLDSRTDIWSLGVILFRLVTGKLPFEGETFPELCANIIGGTPAIPAEPPELARILRRCLAKARNERYADVRELARDLLPLAPPEVRSASASLDAPTTTSAEARPAPNPELKNAADPTLRAQRDDLPVTLSQRFDRESESLAGTAASGSRRTPARTARRVLAVLATASVLAGVSVYAFEQRRSTDSSSAPVATLPVRDDRAANVPVSGVSAAAEQAAEAIAPSPSIAPVPAAQSSGPAPRPAAAKSGSPSRPRRPLLGSEARPLVAPALPASSAPPPAARSRMGGRL